MLSIMRVAVIISASLSCVCGRVAEVEPTERYQRLKPLETMLFAASPSRLSSSTPTRLDASRRSTPEMNLMRHVAPGAAAVALASFLTLGMVDPAEAARTGGRVGGRAPVSRSAPSRSYSAPRTNVYVNPAPRTNVYVSPGIGYGGFGGGYGYGYGGFGGGISTGTYLGISLVETFIREQQRQAYLQEQLRVQQQLGQDQAKIAALQNELAQQNAKVDNLRKESPTVEQDAMAQLKQQLQEQQKEIAELKAR